VPPPIHTRLLVAVVSAGAAFRIDRIVAVSYHIVTINTTSSPMVRVRCWDGPTPRTTARRAPPTSAQLVVDDGLLLGCFTCLRLLVQSSKCRATQTGCCDGNACADPALATRARVTILTTTLRSDTFENSGDRRRGQTSLGNSSVAVFRISGFAFAAENIFTHVPRRGGVAASSAAPGARTAWRSVVDNDCLVALSAILQGISSKCTDCGNSGESAELSGARLGARLGSMVLASASWFAGSTAGTGP
jgi:hypothetical protein